MNFFFDYIFYRVARFYFKWDKRHGITAIAAVTMIQALFIVDICGFILKLIYDREVTKNYVSSGKLVLFLLFIMLCLLNYRKYSGKYFKYKNYWKEETKEKQVYRGILVVLSLVIPWIPLILMGVYW